MVRFEADCGAASVHGIPISNPDHALLCLRSQSPSLIVPHPHKPDDSLHCCLHLKVFEVYWICEGEHSSTIGGVHA